MKKILTLLLLSIVMFSCNKENKNEFKFAVSGEFRPFSYVDKKGELTGFDVELGQLIAKKLKKTPVPVKYKFAGIIEGLKSNRFDAAIASHTITPEREKQVNFSTPYYYSGPQVFSRNEKKKVKLKGLDIAVSKGSTYQRMATNHTENVKIYDSDNTALEALARGRHDAVITDRVIGAMGLKKGLNFFPNQSLGESQQAIAFAKENQDLLQKINTILTEFKADGTLLKLSKKYFASDIISKEN
jgi:polar amino acid transport system substrate-binding protein